MKLATPITVTKTGKTKPTTQLSRVFDFFFVISENHSGKTTKAKECSIVVRAPRNVMG
jgi:hypothetical protein